MKLPAAARAIISLGKTPGGKSLRASRYTVYHWQKTLREFREEFPHAQVYILQGSYNLGVRLSAGTHDGDAVLDVWVTGIPWREAEDFFRRKGWIAWWRHTGSWAAEHSWHIHMITPGSPNRKGSLIPGQIAAYVARRLGLARSADGPDPAPHPKHVEQFDYNEWVRLLEEESMNHVQRADAALPAVISGLNKAIGELRQVDKRKRPRVFAKAAVLVSARTLVIGVEKFLTK